MDNKREELFKNCTQCIAKELPTLRSMIGLTQKDLGEILGVSRQTITNIENGKGKMKWPLFLTIMFIFGLEHRTAEYLKTIDIPYNQIKEWLSNNYGKER